MINIKKASAYWLKSKLKKLLLTILENPKILTIARAVITFEKHLPYDQNYLLISFLFYDKTR